MFGGEPIKMSEIEEDVFQAPATLGNNTDET